MCAHGCAGEGEPAPELSVAMRQVSGLRYGENPHQAAAFYSDLSLAEVGRGGIAGAKQHHGKEVNSKCANTGFIPAERRPLATAARQGREQRMPA